MRAPSDLPPPRRRRRDRRLSSRGRVILVMVLIGLFVLITSLRGIAGVYTDYLWFESLGLRSVWRGIVGARLALGVIFTAAFFVFLYVNLTIADRLAPKFRPQGPEEELLERYHDFVDRRSRLLRAGVSVLFALIAGAGVSSQWNEWILFTHRQDYGIEDPQFHTDIGFYVFQLPFLSFVVSWLFAAFVIILIITAVAHYLNGGIRVQVPGERVTPQVKAHLSVLLGILALIKAGDYWLQRYELTFSTRGAVDGATYTDVNAQLPAIYLLLLISLLSFVLFIVNIWRRGWVLPVLAVGLWGFVAIVAGGIYPAFVQRVQVEPAESSRESEYIARNIEATQVAMGLDDVDVRPFDYNEELDAAALVDNADTVRNIRLLDPGVVNDTYQRLQADRGFYEFADLDVDRYEIDGETTQVIISSRELNESGIPQESWEGQHVAFTHGYGAALAPANAVSVSGRPDFVVGDIPVSNGLDVPLDQPQIYVGEGLGGYSIVGATRSEVDYQDDTGETVTFEYDGEAGVDTGSFVRRAAFALRFGDFDPLLSNLIDEDSRIIYIRDVRDRVEAVAPFLHWDADPYPVISGGNLVYMMDGYTTSSHFPYGQRANTEELPAGSGLDHAFNYVRNSVKAVVDAYDGTVTLYQMPTEDPIIDAYRSAFPDLFADYEDMPEDLQQHIRYPEDLFRVQTNMWGRYHIDDPQEFYEQTGGWEVAQDPGAEVAAVQATQTTTEQGEVTGSRERRIDPYYLLMRLPEDEEESFLILRSFVPTSENDERKELTAFMVAGSDPEEYGRLQVYEMPSTEIDGPAIVNANIASEEEIAERITLLDQQGSEVRFGNLLLIPIEQSILYVRPLYVAARGETQVPELRNVIVAFGDQVEMQPTLQEALTEIFGNAPPTQEAAPVEGEEEPAEEEPVGEDPASEVADLLSQAEDLFVQAEAALADGDLGTYQERVDEARSLIRDAVDQSQPTTTTTAPGGA